MKRQIWIDTLQWFIGIYIAIRGALMLMVPHTLSTHVFVPIQPHLPWLGAWQVIGGVVLIAVATLVPRRPIIVLAHLIAGSALLQAASGHLLAGTWTALADFATLGLGTAIAPFLQTRHRQDSRNGIDLFALLMSIRMVLDGIIVLVPFNPQFNARLYDPVRSYLPLYGIAYLVCGLALSTVYFYPKIPKRLFQAAHLLAGAMLWSWTIGLGFPTWNSVLFYGGLSTLLALLPWLGPYLRRLNPKSLQTQLAVTLVGVVTLPLLFAVTLIALPQEQAVVNNALTLQQTLATALAQDVANYINLHRAAVHALAKQPDLAAMSAFEQRNFLQLINQAYPDIAVFTTFDVAGNAIARSDNRSLSPSIAKFGSYRAAQQGEFTLDVRIGRVLQKPIFTFTAPFYDANQQFAGIVAGAIEASKVTEELIKTGKTANITAYLVDEQGRVIAHPDASLVSTFSDRSQSPPVVAVLQQETAFGGLHYWDDAQWQLVAIVRYMVELHGGTVEADSLGEGQGATFTVRLPLLKSEGVAEQNGGTLPSASVPRHPLSELRILVVDDDDHTREFLVFLLELHGANVIATASASEAIATLKQFQPDVLLSDIGMPDMDGYMLMQQIRALPPEQGGTIPAIALTAYAGEYDHQQALQVGFQRHLAKPVEPEKLVRTIVELALHRSVT